MIDDLLKQRSLLVDQLRELDIKINNEKLSIVYIEHGVREGSIVESKGKRYKVTKINTQHSGKPWIAGIGYKKNGDLGVMERHFYTNWFVVIK